LPAIPSLVAYCEEGQLPQITSLVFRFESFRVFSILFRVISRMFRVFSSFFE
jgi:hypothetical protein